MKSNFSHLYIFTLYFLTFLSSLKLVTSKNVEIHQKLSSLYQEHSSTLQKKLTELEPEFHSVKNSKYLSYCYNKSIINSSNRKMFSKTKQTDQVVDIFEDSLETVVNTFFTHNIHQFGNAKLSRNNNFYFKKRLDVLMKNLIDLAGHVKQCVQHRESGSDEKGVPVGLTPMLFYSEEEFSTSILNHHLEDFRKINQVNQFVKNKNTSQVDFKNLKDYWRPVKESDCSPRLQRGERLPESWSWKEKGVLSPVYEQGHCSSCYVFATTDALEAQYRIKNPDKYVAIHLSVQATLNCVNYGCSGGFLEAPLNRFVADGVPLAAEVPYKQATGTSCPKSFDNFLVKPFTACYNSVFTSDEDLKLILWKRGPVAVSFNTESLSNGNQAYRFFRGSLWTEECSSGPVTHALLLVGWTPQDEWILKNSWGESWGDGGYFRVPMGKVSCGINKMYGFSLL